MPNPTLTFAVAFSAGREVGNRAMRAGGRKVWSMGDYRKACEEFARLQQLIEGDSNGPAPPSPEGDAR